MVVDDDGEHPVVLTQQPRAGAYPPDLARRAQLAVADDAAHQVGQLARHVRGLRRIGTDRDAQLLVAVASGRSSRHCGCSPSARWTASVMPAAASLRSAVS
ncbi:hypothetical protein BJF90_02085 [Pseudonocardia sp. CNS-004]|nr:hypothetical protein BJF90_02085 [Pseudonocardia sp. CNS-004]